MADALITSGAPVAPVPHVDSYYAVSANTSPVRPPAEPDEEADVAIIGAGFTGLSTALHLAERGREVCVLEAARVGWGASGRNGGQVVNGLNAGLDTIARRYGSETASFVGTQVQLGARIIRRFVHDYAIDCDLKSRNVYVAFNTRQMQALEAKQRLWRTHGMDDHEMLDRAALARHVASDIYCGGMVDHSGGHLHPLNLALGEAAAVESLGGRIHEATRVTGIEAHNDHVIVRHAGGRLRCRNVVLCGNAYLGKTVPELEARVMPVSTQVMATEPLPAELAATLLPSDSCVEDVRYILDYYRLSADKRLLFGGGSVYGGQEPRDIVAKLRPHLNRVFPALSGVRITHAWSGNFALSFSRVPQIGQLSEHVWYAMGYSGHGVTGSHLFGSLLADALSGQRQSFDRLAALPWQRFPGGQRFRAPYSTLGSWWYGLRDNLGI